MEPQQWNKVLEKSIYHCGNSRVEEVPRSEGKSDRWLCVTEHAGAPVEMYSWKRSSEQLKSRHSPWHKSKLCSMLQVLGTWQKGALAAMLHSV